MDSTPPLPFPHLQIPAKHLEWFRQANAVNWMGRDTWFYPFKDRFLAAHALKDGHDLQTITKPCHCGDGIWRGYEGTLPPDRWETCNRCRGTKIYLVKQIVLERWLLCGHLYHRPTSWLHLAGDGPYRERIEGYVQHDTTGITTRQAKRACLRLLLRYEPATFLAFVTAIWRQWRDNMKCDLQWKIARVKRLLNIRQTYNPDEIPF